MRSVEFIRSIQEFVINGININVFGMCHYKRVQENMNQEIECSTRESCDGQKLIESAVEQFENKFRNSMNAKDVKAEEISFFGDVYIRNGNIVSFPKYLIITGRKHVLFEIISASMSSIDLCKISEDDDFDDLVEILDSIDSESTELYYMNGDINGIMEDDIEGDLNGDINGIMEDDIEGDLNGDINGIMNGDIEGNLNGDINGIMSGDIKGDLNGDIYGSMSGDIKGDLNGDIYDP